MKLYKIVMGETVAPHLDLEAKVQALLNKGFSPVGAPFYDGGSRHFFQAVAGSTVQSCRVTNHMAAAISQFRVVKAAGGAWVEVTGYFDLQADAPYTVNLLPLIDSGALKNGDECMFQWQYEIYGFKSQRNRPGIGSFYVGTPEPGAKPLVAEARIVQEAVSSDPAKPYPLMTEIQFFEI